MEDINFKKKLDVVLVPGSYLKKNKSQNGIHSVDPAYQLTLRPLPEFWLAFKPKTSSYDLQYEILSPFMILLAFPMTVLRTEQARALPGIMFI